MNQIVAWVKSFAVAIGGPGLFLIAFLDSSVLSLPEINDVLMVWMVARHKERMAFYAIMSTLGSLAGCFLLYYLGRKSGAVFMRKRFSTVTLERGRVLFERYGLLALMIPAILPPPAPFKIFVLLAGVAGIRPSTFALAIAAGRGARFFGEGLLAVWYGDSALGYLRANATTVSLIVAGVLFAGGAGYAVWRAGARARDARTGL